MHSDLPFPTKVSPQTAKNTLKTPRKWAENSCEIAPLLQAVDVELLAGARAIRSEMLSVLRSHPCKIPSIRPHLAKVSPKLGARWVEMRQIGIKNRSKAPSASFS